MEEKQSLQRVKGVGPKKKQALMALGITNVEELVGFLPKSYVYRGNLREISLCASGEKVLFDATLQKPCTRTFLKGKKNAVLLSGQFKQNQYTFTCRFYTAPVVGKALAAGVQYRMFGTVHVEKNERIVTVHTFEKKKPRDNYLTEGLQAVYPLGKSALTQRAFAMIVRSALQSETFSETLPAWVVRQAGVLTRGEALMCVHLPSSPAAYEKGMQRIWFEQFLLRQLSIEHHKQTRHSAPFVFCASAQVRGRFLAALPFAPTDDQQKAMAYLERQFQEGEACNVLLQGDVGCGKSMVAYYGMYLSCLAGVQSVYVLPTKLLCREQAEKLSVLGDRLGFQVDMLCAEMPSAGQQEVLAKIRAGDAKVIVATHSAFGRQCVFKNLGFVVCDEQHRFGVRQRGALFCKGDHPHMLVMSATPIPRTLALALYNDLDVISIHQKPKGKQKILTRVRTSGDLPAIFSFVRQEMQQGRGVYMVAPSIDSPDMASLQMLKALVEEHLSGVAYACVSSATPAPEREKIMQDFSKGRLSLLLATTVVEVGVDNPLASVMVIFDAGRFGLSQLHQLRGRVGRNNRRAYCILIDDTQNASSRERLQVLAECDDGFSIALKDLALRGAGEREGFVQSGHTEYFAQDLLAHAPLLLQAATIAKALLASAKEEDLAYVRLALNANPKQKEFILN